MDVRSLCFVLRTPAPDCQRYGDIPPILPADHASAYPFISPGRPTKKQQALPGLYSQAAGAHPSRSAASPCHAEPSSRREPLPRGVVGLVSASSNQRPSPAGRRIGRSGWIITTTEFPRSVVQTTVDGVPGGLEESVVGRRRTNSAALGYPPLPFVRSSQTSVRHPACSRFAVVVVALRGLVLRGSGGCLRTPFPS